MTKKTIFDTQVLGHPAGLFVLFFTEMWERFSFYGMRVLLINFLTMTLIGYNPGWAWSTENAGALFGTYVMLLYLTPILGGIIADKITGYRWAVIIGAVIITLGHLSMAFETEVSLYLGLALLVIGTGFFKPNMVSFVSEMYKDLPEKNGSKFWSFLWNDALRLLGRTHRVELGLRFGRSVYALGNYTVLVCQTFIWFNRM